MRDCLIYKTSSLWRNGLSRGKRGDGEGGTYFSLLEKMKENGKKRVILIIMLVSSALIIASYFLPWWRFALYAPQYPEGLYMKVYLNKVEGDVSEIDILNHYIGMKKIEEAAKFERKIALPVVVAVAVLPFASMLPLLRSYEIFSVLFCLALAGFVVGFVTFLFYWLWHFGHDLDPTAPIKIAPFTPKLLGWGSVGQFKTFAMFDVGFFMALGAAVVGMVACLVSTPLKASPGWRAIFRNFPTGWKFCGEK